MPNKTETANVVTTILGYDENDPPDSVNGGLRSSAIPWLFDEWFHGDFDTVREQSLTDATGTKTLEEYTSSENPFPDWRINSAIEISFDTPDDKTVSNPQVQMTDPEDQTTPGGVAPVTLEGAPDEPTNPFRTVVDYDGSKNYQQATVKGPLTAGPEKVGPIEGVEGYRASIILGGSDPYLEQLKADGRTLASIAPGANIPKIIADFMLFVPTFYSFLDFVFMADGTTLVRVWDASMYPAHALYVGGTLEDQNEFDEGEEWVTQGDLTQQVAFDQFASEAGFTPFTPFDRYGSWLYEDTFRNGAPPHPVMVHRKSGTSISARSVEREETNPLFPTSV
ncbi:hypothetical protein [Halorarius halobius]|uniref:hypothetical protein n=1 Tax=Halorarius halobius TaxID=2962671 RepID=UPI0020CB9D40|nr:hypothetical protein [Halorarius halobius]